jgi:hypothetical protein
MMPGPVSIAGDRRRLDSENAAVAWLAEVEADHAAGRSVVFDKWLFRTTIVRCGCATLCAQARSGRD